MSFPYKVGDLVLLDPEYYDLHGKMDTDIPYQVVWIDPETNAFLVFFELGWGTGEGHAPLKINTPVWCLRSDAYKCLYYEHILIDTLD